MTIRRISPFLVVVSLLVLALSHAEEAKTKEPRLWRGIDTAGMDASRKPWEDIYQYANGKWIAETDIPSDRSAVYVFTLLAKHNRQLLREILDEAVKDKDAAKDSIRGKVAAFYRSGMDEKKIEEQGVKPLRSELDRIAALKDAKELPPALAHMHTIRSFAAFAFASTPDSKDSRRVIAEFTQGGLSLPDRDYYLKDEARLKKIRGEYVAHVTKMLELLGDKHAEAERQAKTVLAFETRLARASRPRADLRDPQRNYHLMSVADMAKETPGVSWKSFFQALGFDDLKELTIGQPDFLKEVGKMLVETPLSDWKVYLRWKLLNSYADKLSSPFVAEDFHFKGTVLRGTPRNLPRWERVVLSTDHLLGEALGQLYVEKAFPPQAKKKAETLVANLKITLRERLAKLDWMQPKTREEALRKLDAMAVKIGYPAKWRDYSGLAVDREVYVLNVMQANEFSTRFDLGKIGKPVDRTQWEMTPSTVNAYYNPNLNEIVFPAGILQPPFFDAKADDALNYGAMGMVIGHELTHGFDDQGRKFDADGNLRDWWTPEDARTYKQRAQEIREQYSRYVPVDDLKINGEMTLGENIADLGGLKISYLAFKKTLKGKPVPAKIDAFSAEQRFFLSYAMIWRGVIRPDFLRLRLKTDFHSPARFRVLGPLYNMPEFFEVFRAPPEATRTRLNPKPVVIW
ncbi:MAG: M13 family metallopeptidase [Gemmataceae bacterium]